MSATLTMLRNDYFEEVEPIDRPIQSGSTQAQYADRNTGMILPEFTHFSLDGAPYLGPVIRIYEGFECTPVYFSGPTEELDSGYTKRLKYHKEPIRASDPPTFARTLIEAPDPWRDPIAAGVLSGGMASAIAPPVNTDLFPGRPAPTIPSSSLFAQDEIFRYYSLKNMGIDIPKPQSVIVMERENAAKTVAEASNLADVTDVPLDLTAGARGQQDNDVYVANKVNEATLFFTDQVNDYFTSSLRLLLSGRDDGSITATRYKEGRRILVAETRKGLNDYGLDPSQVRTWERAVRAQYYLDNPRRPVPPTINQVTAAAVDAAAAVIDPSQATVDTQVATPLSFDIPPGEKMLRAEAATKRIQDNLDFVRSILYDGLTRKQAHGIIAGRLNVSSNSARGAYKSIIFPKTTVEATAAPP